MPTIGPVVAPSDFTQESEMLTEGSVRQKVIIANNTAVVEFAEASERRLSGPAVPYNAELPLPPGIYDFARRVERVRFKRFSNVEPFPVVTIITSP